MSKQLYLFNEIASTLDKLLEIMIMHLFMIKIVIYLEDIYV